jgi:hypothetical protein
VKCSPRKPTRSCRKKIGPGETILIHTMTQIMSGNQIGRLSKTQVMSRGYFQKGRSVARAISLLPGVCGSFPPEHIGLSQRSVLLVDCGDVSVTPVGGIDSAQRAGSRENISCGYVTRLGLLSIGLLPLVHIDGLVKHYKSASSRRLPTTIIIPIFAS